MTTSSSHKRKEIRVMLLPFKEVGVRYVQRLGDTGLSPY